jgi:hypothetical protein
MSPVYAPDGTATRSARRSQREPLSVDESDAAQVSERRQDRDLNRTNDLDGSE